MTKRLSSVTNMGLLLATAVAAAQTSPQPRTDAASPIPPVTFKVEINYVEVDARVLDAQGAFVHNLRKEEFQILENGKPQAIATFALVNVPAVPVQKPRFATEPLDPDVMSNARTFDGRLYILLLDDLHTHPLRSQRVTAAARKFIADLASNDLAAVVVTSGNSEASQELTSNHRLLLRAVDKFVGQKPRSGTLEKIDQYNDLVGSGLIQPSQRVDDSFSNERLSNARRSMDSVHRVAEWLGGIRSRRKAVIFISEGIDYDITDVFTGRDNQFNFNKADVGQIQSYTSDAIATATRSNVVVYALDPRGLTTLADESIELASVADMASPADLGGPNQFGSGRSDLGQRSLSTELQISQDSLRSLADGTGGFAAINSNDFTTAFGRIQDENSAYYAIGYYPADDKRDGKFRKIDVRISRSGLTVRARKGYLAPRGKPNAPGGAPSGIPNETSTALRRLLENPMQVSGLTMNVSAAPFKGAAPNATVSVLVEVRGRDLKFAEKAGTFNGALSMFVGAFDKDGKVKAGVSPSLKPALKPETHRHVMEHGIRMQSSLDLPPGRYLLRVVAHQEAGKDAQADGSVQYDLEVPDFSKEPLAMSGLVVSSLSADRALTVGSAGAPLEGALSVPPTALREFPATDELSIFVEVYDGHRGVAHTVDITSTVRAYDGALAFKKEEARSSEELQGARAAYSYTTRIPLKGLAPGMYLLAVEARSRSGNGEAVNRTIQFRIQGDPAVPERQGR